MDVNRSAMLNALFGAIIVACVAIVTSSAYVVYGNEDEFPVVARRALHPACSRCVLNHGDWASCSACYRRGRWSGSRIPYYGFRKRSAPEAVDDFDGDDVFARTSSSDEGDDDEEAMKLAETERDEAAAAVEEAAVTAELRCCLLTGEASCCRAASDAAGLLMDAQPSEKLQSLSAGLMSSSRYSQLLKAELEFNRLVGPRDAICSCCSTALYDFTCCQLKCSAER